VALLAAHLGVTPAAVKAARSATHAYHLVSLDVPHAKSVGTESFGIGDGNNRAFTAVDDRLWLVPALDTLSVRERRILAMRFFDEMTQTQIAAEVGVSQMQISRLLAKTLRRLHTVMAA